MHFKDLVEKYTKLSAFIHMNRKAKKSKMSIQDDPIPEHTSSDDGKGNSTATATANAAAAADDDDDDIERKSDCNVNDHNRNDNDRMDFLKGDDKGNFNIRCVGAAFQVCISSGFFSFVFSLDLLISFFLFLTPMIHDFSSFAWNLCIYNGFPFPFPA